MTEIAKLEIKKENLNVIIYDQKRFIPSAVTLIGAVARGLGGSGSGLNNGKTTIKTRTTIYAIK